MAANKRNRSQIARDRREITRMYLYERLSQPEIAERLNEDKERGYTLTQQMVSYDLKQVQSDWFDSALFDFNAAKRRELAKVDELELIYYDAWLRSCEDAEVHTQKTKGEIVQTIDPKAGFVSKRPAEVTKVKKGQAGDPRFLQGVQWCIERRCKILGVDAPEKHDHNITYDLEEWKQKAEERIERFAQDGGECGDTD